MARKSKKTEEVVTEQEVIVNDASETAPAANPADETALTPEGKALKVMYDEAFTAAVAVVNAMNDHRPEKEVKALKKACKMKCDTYNANLAKAYYRKLAKEYGHDAVKNALIAEETAVPEVIKFSFKRADDDTAHYEQVTPKIKVSLADMMDTIGKEYFHNPEWFDRASSLARLMAVALNKDLQGSAAFQYVIAESSKAFKFNESVEPTSNTSMVKAFQMVIDEILWIGDAVNKKGVPVNGLKFENRHWTYIQNCMSRQGSIIGEVDYGSPSLCIELVADCIHMMLTNKGFNLKVS